MSFFFTIKKTYYQLLVVTVLMTISSSIISQEQKPTHEDKYSINWISQFPSLRTGNQKVSFKAKLVKVLFGEKESLVIDRPFGIVAFNPDTFYISDQRTGRIICVNNGVAQLSKFKNQSNIEFVSLVGFSSISKDKLMVTDSYLNKIFTISLKDKKLYSLNDSITINQPTGISYNEKSEEIWVVETAAHRILIFNCEGKLLRTIGGRGSDSGHFNFPTFIWIDKAGNVYVVDSMNYKIQIFDYKGEFISSFGEIGNASGCFARPKGIATDSFGHIYIIDGLFHKVQIFDKHGNYLYSFGGQGLEEGKFWLPTGIYIDNQNYIYIADTYNSRVQIFQLIIKS